MMNPLLGALAADGIPVPVTRRVLKVSRQPYDLWLAHPVRSRELDKVYLANVLFLAHRDYPEFGHRLLADEADKVGL